jgi:hypothetical protein
MIRKQWINKYCNGLTFCDVGGLWGIVNENISDAINAKSRTLLDKFPKSDPLWQQMRNYLKVDYEEISANLNEINRSWDIVNCAGVIYHYPKPHEFIALLSKITNKYLIITTTFTNHVVENKYGKIQTNDFFYMPEINETEREILKEDWREFLGNKPASGLVYLDDWTKNTYEHWWWLFTEKYLDQLFTSSNLKIVEKFIEGKTISYFLKVEKTFL